MSAPPWLAPARAWPVAFAQVREDPRIDEAIADRLPAESSLLMVASGGCTAAFLANHSSLREIILVDSNPAQLALARLKLKLLEETDTATRCAVLGHSAMDASDRAAYLEREFSGMGLPPDALGPLPLLASVGPDYAGRYEQLFAALQSEIRNDSVLAPRLAELLDLESPEKQVEWLERNVLWWARLEAVFERVLALENLVALFGEEATRNPHQPFAAHFLERLRHLVTHQPLRHNAFVRQMLHSNGARAAWLQRPIGASRNGWRFTAQAMTDAMRDEAAEGRRHDMVHLSNILDWLDPRAATRTLQSAWDCTEPGGWVVIRQLNSTLDIRALGKAVGWEWDARWSEELLGVDQSFFYRMLHIGRKRCE